MKGMRTLRNNIGMENSERLEEVSGQRSKHIRKVLKMHPVTRYQKYWEVRIQQMSSRLVGELLPEISVGTIS